MARPNYCQEFLRNPSVNPETGRKIQVDGPTYRKLVKECGEPSPELLATTSYCTDRFTESCHTIDIPQELLFYDSPFESLVPDITLPQPPTLQPAPAKQPTRPGILPRQTTRTPIQSSPAPTTAAPQRQYLQPNRLLPTRQAPAIKQPVSTPEPAAPPVVETKTEPTQLVSIGQITPKERELTPLAGPATPAAQRLPAPPRMASPAAPATQRLPAPPRMASQATPATQPNIERGPLKVQTIPMIPQGRFTVPIKPRVTGPVMRPTEVTPEGGMSRNTMFEILINSDIGTINQLCKGNRNFRNICQDDNLWKLLFERDFANKPFYKFEVKEGPQIKWYNSYIRTYQMLHFFNQLVPHLVTIIDIPYREDGDGSWLTADRIYDNMEADVHDAMSDVVKWAKRFNPPNKTYINRLEDFSKSTYGVGSNQDELFQLQDDFNDYLEDIAHGTSDSKKTLDEFVSAGAEALRA